MGSLPPQLTAVLNVDAPFRQLTDRGVRALVLFGSNARGDADDESDLDICCFADDLPFGNLDRLRSRTADILDLAMNSVSVYSATTAERMASKGSLFLWHLRLEGRILLDPTGYAEQLLDRLATFENYERELRIYQALWEDTRDAFLAFGFLTEFDYHVLHGVVRDCCILLCYSTGEPAFGRVSAYERASRAFSPFPMTLWCFSLLTDWHLTYLRNAAPKALLPSPETASGVVRSVGEVIGLCESRFC